MWSYTKETPMPRGVDYMIDRALTAIEAEHAAALRRLNAHIEELHRHIKADDIEFARHVVDEWEAD